LLDTNAVFRYKRSADPSAKAGYGYYARVSLE